MPAGRARWGQYNRAKESEHLATTSTAPVVDFFALDSTLTVEEREVRDRVRTFAEEVVRPVAAQFWERAEFPHELVSGLAGLRIAGGAIDGYGCPGMSSVAYGLALQELARVDASVCTFFAVQSSLAMNAIYYCGTEEQRRQWLPAMASLEKIGAFALTEPDVGSDAANLQTTAVRQGDSIILNGRKRWIGNGTICDVAVVWARTEDGTINGFLVPSSTPGYSAEVIVGKLSNRAVWQADIALDNCRVPAENHLSRMPGFGGTATVLMHARLGVAWGVLGQAIDCYETALRYARDRTQFGKSIAGFQLVQEKLVTMLNGISLAQLGCVHVSRLRDGGQLTPAMVALLKMNHSQMAREVALHARDILGGNGILNEYGVMRHLCDLESAYTYEGTHDINMLVVGREITGLSAFK